MSDVPTNGAGEANFAKVASPLFVSKRWAGMKEYIVPPENYNMMKYGREPGDKWADFIEDETLRNDVRGAFHKEGKLLATCAKTGASCIIRKKMRK